MQKTSIYNFATTTYDGVKAKTVWHRPSVNRVDIKRTLAAPGSLTDGGSPTT